MKVQNGAVPIVRFPLRVWKRVRKVQGCLTRELGRKLNTTQGILVASRATLPATKDGCLTSAQELEVMNKTALTVHSPLRT